MGSNVAIIVAYSIVERRHDPSVIQRLQEAVAGPRLARGSGAAFYDAGLTTVAVFDTDSKVYGGDETAVAKAIRSIGWKYPSELEVLIRTEHDDTFRRILGGSDQSPGSLADPDEAHVSMLVDGRITDTIFREMLDTYDDGGLFGSPAMLTSFRSVYLEIKGEWSLDFTFRRNFVPPIDGTLRVFRFADLARRSISYSIDGIEGAPLADSDDSA